MALAAAVALSVIAGPVLAPSPAVAVSYQERMEEKAARKQALLDSYAPGTESVVAILAVVAWKASSEQG